MIPGDNELYVSVNQISFLSESIANLILLFETKSFFLSLQTDKE